MGYAGMGVHDEATELLAILRQRTEPLDIRLAPPAPAYFENTPAIDGLLVAAHFDYSGTCDVNLTLQHPQGDIHFGQSLPPRAWLWNFDDKLMNEASYEDLADAIAEYEHVDITAAEWTPWVPPGHEAFQDCFDSSGKLIKVTSGLRRAMNDWLHQPDLEMPLDGAPPLSESLVGYSVGMALPAEDVERLGLLAGEFGDPGGTLHGVAYRGALEDLQEAFVRNQLPFRLIESTGTLP